MADSISVFGDPTPRIRKLSPDRPWRWLQSGWNDLMAAPRIGMIYGAVLAAVGFLFSLGLWLVGAAYLVLPLTAGFAIMAPVLAVGLYETSRRLALGEPATLSAALFAWRANPTQIGLMGAALLVIHLAWIRVATLLYALFFASANPGFAELVETTLFSPLGLPFLVVGGLIGAAFATVAFAISVVSIPMLLDRNTNVVSAMIASVVAVRANPRPMALWAGLIVVFAAFGLATCYVGLIVVLPLIGHASWHAYKDVVE